MPDLSKYAWADYLDSMDGLPEPMILRPQAPTSGTMRTPAIAWGLAAAGVITGLAILISELPFAPFTLSGNRHPIEPVMLAIILGMIAANLLPLPKLLQPGLKFATKKLLPLAIVLLGARLDFYKIIQVGAAGAALSVLTIIAGLGLFLIFIKLKWVEQKLGMLLGIGTAICGGTAIVAAAPVIDADEKDVTFSVATVTLCGLLAMFLLPVLGSALGLSDKAFGIWAGLSIHQTPQVIAAGYAYSAPAGDTATIVKLARVCLLAPVLILAGWMAARNRTGSTGQRVQAWRVFPMFVLGFLAMALLRTMGVLPTVQLHQGSSAIFKEATYSFSIAGLCENLSWLLIILAMAAVGLETRFAALKQTGARPLLLGLAASVIICGVILLGLRVAGM